MCRDFTNLDIFPYKSWVYQEVVLVSRRNHHLSGAEAVRRVNRGSNKNLELTEMVKLASNKCIFNFTLYFEGEEMDPAVTLFEC